MPAHHIAVLVGSLRKQSFSRKLALNLAKLAPASLKLEIIEIGNLPLYNQDDDASPPAASAAFKQAIKAATGVLFITPEYNRSVPGVLKNAIDIASRPYGQSAWSGKPAGVVSCSPGNIGGYGATCARAWSFSTCLPWPSPKPISAASTNGSTNKAASPTRPPRTCCKSSSTPTPSGSTRTPAELLVGEC
jgi:chromate reductase